MLTDERFEDVPEDEWETGTVSDYKDWTPWRLFTVARWSCGREIDRRDFYAPTVEIAFASARGVWPSAATLICVGSRTK